jgi:hypothetical protein
MAAMPAKATPWESEIARLDGVAESLEKATRGHSPGVCPCYLCQALFAVSNASCLLAAVADGLQCDHYTTEPSPAPKPAPAKPKGTGGDGPYRERR